MVALGTQKSLKKSHDVKLGLHRKSMLGLESIYNEVAGQTRVNLRTQSHFECQQPAHVKLALYMKSIKCL